jgi:electron transfer flavoprotein beta subunit
MKIAVCLSHVPDTTTRIKIGSQSDQIDYTGVQWVINPWDELALTRALELKELHGSGVDEVVVVNVGDSIADPVIRKALAIGADRAVRVNTAPSDSLSVARILAAFFATERFDLILAGLESSDYNGGMTGMLLGGVLGYRTLNGISALNLEAGKLKLSREMDGSRQILVVEPPLVAVVQKGIAIVPRIPSMRGVMQARTKPLQVVDPVKVEAGLTTIGYSYPKPKGACRMVAPGNENELVALLKTEARVL